jgi:DNA-binding MarR family transcriptional regulator
MALAPSWEAPATELQDLVSLLGEMRRWVREVHQLSSWQHAASAMSALALADRLGPARVGQLAEEARVHVSVMSRTVSSLERAGLVARTADPVDGRAQLLELTPAGSAALDQGRSWVTDYLSVRLAAWDADDLRQLNVLLRRVIDDLTAPPSDGLPESLPHPITSQEPPCPQ